VSPFLRSNLCLISGMTLCRIVTARAQVTTEGCSARIAKGSRRRARVSGLSVLALAEVDVLEKTYAIQSNQPRPHAYRVWGGWIDRSTRNAPTVRARVIRGDDNGRPDNSSTVLAREFHDGSWPHYSSLDSFSAGVAQSCEDGIDVGLGHAHSAARPMAERKSRGASSRSHGRAAPLRSSDAAKEHSERSAWNVVWLWREVVDSAVKDVRAGTMLQYATAVQAFDILRLSKEEQKKVVLKTGLSLGEISQLQQMRGDAEMCLLHIHMGLVVKASSRMLLREPRATAQTST
jgi:hypothetical protein